jgi:hypothetical protein
MSGALSIVQVNVAQQVGEAPNLLQQTCAAISQGSTTATVDTLTLITQVADLTAILPAAKAISTIAWASSVATVTTAAPHGFTTGDTISLVIAGAVPTAYNGTFTCTVTGASTFTYPLASNPGSETTPGAYLVAEEAELLAMVTTWFSQGTANAFYVLELGAGNANDGVAALTTWLNANPYTVYSIIVPREWDANANFLALLASYENTTAQLYFFVTTTLGTYSNYTSLMKCVFALIEAPGIPATEFSVAAAAWVLANYNPSAVDLVTPFCFSYVYGVTPYPTKGNAATRTALKAANTNIIATGSEGGITNTIILWGTTKDGHDFTYWYSVDWVQIHINEDISNAVINGSNNPQNPLYYDQAGITRLQVVAQDTMSRGVTFGLVLPPVTVSAIPFAIYVVQNPSDYPLGIYRGLAVTYTPQRGFTQIIFNVTVSAFPSNG